MIKSLGMGRRRYHEPDSGERKDKIKVNNERTTPQAFFDMINVIFKFTLDAAANEYNTKCKRYLTDALHQPWNGRVFINPPYSHGNLPQFIDCARVQSMRKECEFIVMLIPADTSVKHFPWDADALCWLNTRLAFGTGDCDGISAPFANALAIFARDGLTAPQIACLGRIGHGWTINAGRVRLFGERLIKSRVPQMQESA